MTRSVATLTHPKAPQVRTLAEQGLTDKAISRQAHMDARHVRQIRELLGLPRGRHIVQPLTLEEKWATFTQPLDGGHLEWTGETANPSGTPVMRYKEQTYTAARVAFRIKHGREPEGHAKAGCTMPRCVAPNHVLDTPMRIRHRESMRLLLGMGPRPERCAREHDQAKHGRLLPNGVAYCQECTRELRDGGQ